MKQEKALFLAGNILIVAAFVTLSAGAVLDILTVFLIGLALLIAGIVFSMILPAINERNWLKLINEHGVPAVARLVNCEKSGARYGELRLDFEVEGCETLTSAYCQQSAKTEYKLDSLWNIRYNPSDSTRCILQSPVATADATTDNTINDEAANNEVDNINSNTDTTNTPNTNSNSDTTNAATTVATATDTTATTAADADAAQDDQAE